MFQWLQILNFFFFFMYLFAICMSSSKNRVFTYFASFSVGLFSCWLVLSSLFILNISPCSNIRLANTFSYSVGVLFTLLMVSFAVKIFHLIQSLLSIFTFIFCALKVMSEKLLSRPLSFNFSSIFFSSTSMVWGLIFKCLIHVELILV